MRTIQALAMALALPLALAGCSGDDDTPGTSTSSSPSATSSSTNATAPANLTNRAPTANLTADPATGTAPINVTFSVAGNDSDGDDLEWTLAFGDGSAENGTTLPTTVVHEYAAGGNFSAVLMVSDGRANATANATVAVAAGSAGFAPGMDPACQRPDAVGGEGGFWLDDRGGGSIWVYEESNGIDGLQLTAEPSPVPAPVGGHTDSLGASCLGGDTMLF